MHTKAKALSPGRIAGYSVWGTATLPRGCSQELQLHNVLTPAPLLPLPDTASPAPYIPQRPTASPPAGSSPWQCGPLPRCCSRILLTPGCFSPIRCSGAARPGTAHACALGLLTDPAARAPGPGERCGHTAAPSLCERGPNKPIPVWLINLANESSRRLMGGLDWFC